MGYRSLIIRNPRTLGFGFLNTFFAGLGQTHFIAIFNPLIMSHFALNNSQYGTLYSLATLASAMTIPFIGPLIDRYDLRYFAILLALGLVVSQCLTLSEHSLVLLFIGLFGLRLFGQGLFSSLSSISIARFFEYNRGKALSLSQLGYPAFEGLMTPLAAFLLIKISHQGVIIAFSLLVLLIYIPLCFLLTRSIPEFNKPSGSSSNDPVLTTEDSKHWTRKQVFRNPTIYFVLPQAVMPAFALTGVFFHQAAIAEMKGWTLSLMASGLFFFALAKIPTLFIAGPMVDKHSATKLYPYFLLPMGFGFLIMALSSQLWVPAFCFACAGFTVGCGGTIKSAIWAELYGTHYLGAIKSILATLMILSTAIAPALFGFYMDYFKEPHSLLLILFAMTILSSLLSFLGLNRLHTKQT